MKTAHRPTRIMLLLTSLLLRTNYFLEFVKSAKDPGQQQ